MSGPGPGLRRQRPWRRSHAPILILAVILTVALIALEAPPSFLSTWGSYGTGPGQFDTPVGITLDGAGNIYVTDRLNHRIQKFDQDGQHLATWGSFGTAPGQFKEPFGIAVDHDGTIFVSEFTGQRIQVLDPDGQPIAAWGSLGTTDGKFNSPSGLALDDTEALLVADMGNNRIQKFDRNGTFLTKWGTFGSGDGQLNFPVDVAADDAGHVYVAEFNGNRVSRFDTNGLYLGKWGSAGSGDGQFSQTYGIATDGAGNVYVSDRFNHRIQKFDSVGVLLTKWGTFGTGPGQFQQPGGIVISSGGNIFVVDRFNHRVQTFGSLDQPPVAVAGLDQSFECAGPDGTLVTLDGSASYDPDGEPIVEFTWLEGALVMADGPKVTMMMAPGRHQLTLRVADAAGHTATDDVVVSVGDTRPPSLGGVRATPDTLWPPTGQMVQVSVAAFATDACDPTPRCRIETISVNEPASGKGPDWDLQGDLLVALRAVKGSSANERVYSLGVVCTDSAGLSESATATVVVPKSLGKGQAKK